MKSENSSLSHRSLFDFTSYFGFNYSQTDDYDFQKLFVRFPLCFSTSPRYLLRTNHSLFSVVVPSGGTLADAVLRSFTRCMQWCCFDMLLLGLWIFLGPVPKLDLSYQSIAFPMRWIAPWADVFYNPDMVSPLDMPSRRPARDCAPHACVPAWVALALCWGSWERRYMEGKIKIAYLKVFLIGRPKAGRWDFLSRFISSLLVNRELSWTRYMRFISVFKEVCKIVRASKWILRADW